MRWKTRSRRRLLGAALTATTVAIGAASAVTAVTAAAASSAQAPAALGGNWYGAAPYVMPFDNSPPALGPVMSATGQKSFQLAFILAPNGGGCQPTWDGTHDVSSDTTAKSVIDGIRAAGGDVTVSVGGYGGTKLGQTCGDPASTAAAYQQVINKYALKAIDLDLEEPEYENTAAIHNEIGAARILQQNNSGLYVSITTAGTTGGEGTGWFGKQMLLEAKSQGFTPANYAIMPFDGGFSGASAQISALEGFHSTLMSTFGWDSGTAYAREGVSLMNGRSDTGEYFRQADFQSVLDYVTSHGLSRYTFWSVNRDRQCNPPDNGTTSGTCSSVAQGDWDFTKYTARFGGATPPTSPPPTDPPGGCTAAPWSSSAIYTGGMEASYTSHMWKAKWWTQGETPGHADVWADEGPCT
jgi:chitinase